MPDYGHDLEFGIFPSPNATSLQHTVELAHLAEVVGLDHVSIQDHPYQAKHVDTWTLLTWIGAGTSTIRLSPNVASLPLRQPVILAKAAATLDLLTHGRVELGLGAGAFWQAIAAAGGPQRAPGEAVDALIEAVDILRAFWHGETVDVRGTHYTVRGLHAGPRPAHDIPIWVGAYRPRMLRVTGRLADAWVPSMGYADPPALAGLNAVIDDAAVAAGRSPEQIRRHYNVFGQFGSGDGFLQGPASTWAEQLAELTLTDGMSTYILGTDDPDAIRRFAAEVAPAVRQLVEDERHRTAIGERAAFESVVAQPDPEPTRPSPSDAGPLTVRPTPDDRTRLTSGIPWSEDTRPSYPESAQATYPAERNAIPQHLIDIHDGLRGELRQLRDVLDQVRRGQATVGQARSIINTMTMRQNNWTLGAYCESYCRIVTGHHTLEDRSVFPHLRRSEPALAPVLDQLELEHHDIHGLVEDVDRALVTLVTSDGVGAAGTAALDGITHAVDVLTDALLSHLSYEERELIGPLARHGFQ
ncbi:MAG: LLM class flavin-dependent oxidoreductase [Phycicoccus sp.]|nr:LLM class flavin-dependent oxidoreductase [Phycicoccus sp.]